MRVLLVGCGNIAKSYIKVLKDLEVKFDVIGNGEENAASLSKEFDFKVITGGIEKGYQKLEYQPTHAIIATPINTLCDISLFLLNRDIPNILIEKPGALSVDELSLIKRTKEQKNANVFVAYNRRFYQSVEELMKIIGEKSVKSIIFEFTEWSHILREKEMPKYKSDNWFIANSTHLVDLAFFVGGMPKEWTSYVKSDIEWHPKGSIFSGSGITEKDILFSYHANWSAPGSWKLEVLTDEERYILRPLEELNVQKLDSFEINKINLATEIDTIYKPGFYKQINAFLYNSDDIKLLNIHDAIKNFEVFEKMLTNSNNMK